MKTKNYLISIIVITLIFILGLIYRQSFRIDGIIIFEHKYEVEVVKGRVYTELIYLTNADGKDITTVKFDNLDTYINNSEAIYMYFDKSSKNIKQRFKHYSLKGIWIEQFLDDKDIEKLKDGPIILDKATITYSDNTTERVSFGEIILIEGNNYDDSIRGTGGSGNNPKIGSTVYSVNGTETIESISSHFLYDIVSNYNITVNNFNIHENEIGIYDKEYFFESKAKRVFTVVYEEKENIDPFIFREYILIIKLDNGEYGEFNIKPYKYFTEEEINRYVREMRDKHE